LAYVKKGNGMNMGSEYDEKLATLKLSLKNVTICAPLIKIK
jgi:hypothetical protein